MSAAGGQGPQGDDALQPRAGFAITPNDSTDLTPTVTKGLMVTVAGRVDWSYAETVATIHTMTVTSVPVYIPGHIARVKVATTATVVGLGG